MINTLNFRNQKKIKAKEKKNTEQAGKCINTIRKQ